MQELTARNVNITDPFWSPRAKSEPTWGIKWIRWEAGRK